MLNTAKTIITNALMEYLHSFPPHKMNILHIHTNSDYQSAQALIEYLFSLAEGSNNASLNNMIAIITRSIEEYEANQAELTTVEVL